MDFFLNLKMYLIDWKWARKQRGGWKGSPKEEIERFNLMGRRYQNNKKVRRKRERDRQESIREEIIRRRRWGRKEWIEGKKKQIGEKEEVNK